MRINNETIVIADDGQIIYTTYGEELGCIYSNEWIWQDGSVHPEPQEC
jgi:hypothetical protein